MNDRLPHKQRIWMLSVVRNLSDDTKTSSLILKYLLPFLVSAILGAVVSSYLGFHSVEDNNISIIRSLILILACFILMSFCVFIAVLRLIAVEEQRNMHRITVSKDHPELPHGRSTAFDYCSAVAKQARHSIYVVGPHFTNMLHDPPGTASHSDYLAEGMSAAISRHSEGANDHDVFDYFRVIQLDPSKSEQTVNEDGYIAWDAIGNKALSEHVNDVLNTNKGSEFINVNIYARDFVPSLPSILVIDEQFVFFSLPTYLTRIQQEGEGKVVPKSKTSRPTLNYDFVFEIEDKSGLIPQQFKRLIRQLSVDAHRLQGVHGKTVKSENNNHAST